MSSKLRVVLAGCGGITHCWLGSDAVKSGKVEIVGLVDLKRKSAQARAEQFNLDKAVVGTNLKEVLKATQPEAVFDCTVPEAHCEITTTALRHGCHVLGEKPMADSMSSARKMVAAAKKARKIYAVTQTRRYIPATRAVERFIASGAIGKVTTVQSNFFVGAHFEGFRQKMQHVLLLDMAIHTFDTMRQFTKQRPKTVYATDWNPTGSTYRHGANASAIFEMTNGVVYSYTGSWTADGCNTSWHGDWQIVGTEGSMRWHHDSNYEAQIIVNKSNFTRKMKDVTVPTKCPKKLVGNHNGLIEEFKRCIKNGGKPETTCTDNIHSLAMVCGAIKSAETGRKVTI